MGERGKRGLPVIAAQDIKCAPVGRRLRGVDDIEAISPEEFPQEFLGGLILIDGRRGSQYAQLIWPIVEAESLESYPSSHL